jgi:D-alanyl-D-alanine carboxypeptidase
MRCTLIVFVATAWVALPAAQPDRYAAAWARLDEFVTERLREANTPGLALAVTSRERLLHVGTYGFANVETRRPVASDTLFEIGSISKSFTAIALLQLRDEGKFDPRMPIMRYLPWFSIKTQYEPVTGHHLMSHTAGFPRDRDDVPSSLYQAYGLRERETGYAPGVHYAYSNVGYQVMGYALEAIAKRPYADVISDRILRPLGMRASDAQFTHETRPRIAVGYERMYDDRPSHPSHPLVPATWLEYAAGDGSIVSTPADMAAYARMLLNRGAGDGSRRVLSDEGFTLLTQRAFQTGKDTWYGYGMGTSERDGGLVLRHSGGMVGYSSMLVADVEAGVGAVVLVNGPGRASAVADFAIDVARAAIHKEPLPAVPAPDDPTKVANANDYPGDFQGAEDHTLTVRAHGGRLLVAVNGGSPVAAERRGTDAFLVNSPAMDRFLLRFKREDGKVTWATHGGDTYVTPAYREKPRSMPSAEWLAYRGHYRTTHAWFNNFRIVVRPDGLFLLSPDGGETKMEPLGPDVFKEEGMSAERLRFDSIVDGQALRANLSGVDYYRVFTR